MQRFETLRRGVLRGRAHNDVSFSIRVVREAGSERYRVVKGTRLLDEAWSSIDDACHSQDNDAYVVEWGLEVLASPEERACFVCRAGLGEPQDERVRYPHRLCFVCMHEIVDEQGRQMTYRNIDMSGGFVAVCKATGEESENHVCFVRGIRCWADEAYGGGIVVTPGRG